MKNVLIHNLKVLLTFMVILFAVQNSVAQSINGVTLVFRTNLCQQDANDPFVVTATYSGDYPASTEFVLSLVNSDNLEIEIQRQPIDLSTTDIEFSFNFDEDLIGGNYRIHITDPDTGTFGRTAIQYPAWVFPDIRYELDPTCFFGGGTASAFPADLDSYIWEFSSISGIDGYTIIAGENSNSLEVSQVGYYRFIEDFGECTSVFQTRIGVNSNFLEVKEAAGEEIQILPPPSLNVCPDDEVVLTSTIDDALFYFWRKDGAVLNDIASEELTISGSDTRILTISGIDMEGEYTVEFSNDLETDSEACNAQSDIVTVELLTPKIEITSSPVVLLLAEGQTTTLEAEIVRPGNGVTVIGWYRHDDQGEPTIQLPNSNTLSIEVSEAGVYTVAIAAASVCGEGFSIFADETVTIGTPDSISNIVIGFVDGHTPCVSEQAELQVESLAATFGATSSQLTEEELDAFNFTWERDGVIVDGENGRSIIIDSASDNGTYRVVVQGEPSNPETVILALDSFTISQEPAVLEAGGSVTLSLGLVDTTDFSFQWIREPGQEIIGETGASLIVTQPGIYTVEVSSTECPPETPPGITVSSGSVVIPNVITPNNDGTNDNWVLPPNFNNSPDVEVFIYTSSGQLDFSGVNYNGNWPNESQSNAVGTIYYYIINGPGGATEQGSITIIR